MTSFLPDEPVVIGFSGKAGSGKTETAKALIPQQTYHYTDVEKFPPIIWEHYWFSAPLYEMASVKRTVSGTNSRDRQLFLLHDILFSLIGSRIAYDDFVELVYDIYAMPCEQEGVRPRTFLTHASDMIKEYYPECFTEAVNRKIQVDYKRLCDDVERNDQDLPWFIAIVSDIRYPHEADMVSNYNNSLLFKFETSDEVRHNRLHFRDGGTLTLAQQNHNSELGFDEIKDDKYDYIVNTDSLTLDQQVDRIYTTLSEFLPLPALEVSQ